MMSDFHTIENDHLKLAVSNLGAEMKSLYIHSWSRELLWVPKSENEKLIWSRTSPILFPIVGKLKNNSYRFNQKTYSMPQHGFARDSQFNCLKNTKSELELSLHSNPETFQQYPFHFELKVRYFLVENTLSIIYTTLNTGQQDLYFSIGAHPAFATPDLSHYEIRFEKNEKEYFQLNNGLVDFEQLFPVESNIVKPSESLFKNDALIFQDVQSSYIELIHQQRNEIVRLNGIKTPYFGIWGKASVPFICLEPWYGLGDDTHHDQTLIHKKGVQFLPPGDEFVFSFSIEIRA